MANNEKQQMVTQLLENEIQLIHPEDYSLLKNHLRNFNKDIDNALGHFIDLQLARKKAKNIRYRSIENMGYHLEAFEKNARKNRTSVYWAKDGQGAVEKILSLLSKTNSQSIYKSNAPELNELQLAEVLTKKNKKFNYINVSEYISKLLNENAAHPVHKLIGVPEEKIRRTIKEHLQGEGDFDDHQLIEKVNDKLRAFPEFPSVGISGADFLVAENGAMVCADNEGCSNWISSCVSIHIVVAGIERIVPTMDDLDAIMPLHTAFHHGSQHSRITNIINGPGKPKEAYGPTQIHLILLDNGRSDILKHTEWREMLYDLDAMSFLNSCVNYQSINKNNYHPHLLGPIGTVMSPLLYNEETYGHLSFLHHEFDNKVSNPYLLNMQKMLLNTRAYLMEEQKLVEAPVVPEVLEAIKSRDKDKMNNLNTDSKFQRALKKFTGWFTEFPFANKTFNEWWREKKG